MLSPPFKWQAEAEGYTRLGAQSVDVSEEWPKGAFAARETFLRDNPNSVKAFLRGHVKALRLARADRQLAVQTLMNVLKYEGRYADLAYEEVMDGYDERGRLPTRSMPAFWDVAIAAGDATEPWPESKLLDPSFVSSFDEWAPK